MPIDNPAVPTRRGDPSTVPPGMTLDPSDFFEPSNPGEPPRTPWQRFIDALADGDFERAYRALDHLFEREMPIGFIFHPDGEIQLFGAGGLLPADVPLGPPFLPGVLDAIAPQVD